MIVQIISFVIEQRVLDPAYFENAADGLSISDNGQAKRCSAVVRFKLDDTELEGTFYLTTEAQQTLEALLAQHIAVQKPV